MKIIKRIPFVSGLVPAGRTARMFAVTGVTAAALVLIWVRTAVATPSSNVVSGAIIARASFLDPVDIKFKVKKGNEEVVHVFQAQDTVIQQVIIGPGGHTGWHSHPGPAVAMIKSGAVALYDSEDPTCTPRVYLAGQAFVDHGQGHVHLARNMSATENVEIWVTYFDVPPGTSVRLDAADPGNCAP
jgi:hypothetical protein